MPRQNKPIATKRQTSKFSRRGVSRVFLSLDLFQSQSTWRVDEANASLASPVGAISSILLCIVLLAYTALKVDTFVNKKAVDVKVS